MTIVKCDEHDCDWKLDIAFDSVPEWYDKPCPKCGKGVILNDADMEVYYFMAHLFARGIIEEPSEGETACITIDTENIHNRMEETKHG